MRKRTELQDKLAWCRLKSPELESQRLLLTSRYNNTATAGDDEQPAEDDEGEDEPDPAQAESPPRVRSPSPPGQRQPSSRASAHSNWLPHAPVPWTAPPPPGVTPHGGGSLSTMGTRCSRAGLLERGGRRPATVEPAVRSAAGAGGPAGPLGWAGNPWAASLDHLAAARPGTCPAPSTMGSAYVDARHGGWPSAGGGQSMPGGRGQQGPGLPDIAGAGGQGMRGSRAGGGEEAWGARSRGASADGRTGARGHDQGPPSPFSGPAQSPSPTAAYENGWEEPAEAAADNRHNIRFSSKDYVRMQRDLIREGMHRRRAAPGYRGLASEPKEAVETDLKTALAAVFRREVEARISSSAPSASAAHGTEQAPRAPVASEPSVVAEHMINSMAMFRSTKSIELRLPHGAGGRHHGLGAAEPVSRPRTVAGTSAPVAAAVANALQSGRTSAPSIPFPWLQQQGGGAARAASGSLSVPGAAMPTQATSPQRDSAQQSRLGSAGRRDVASARSSADAEPARTRGAARGASPTAAAAIHQVDPSQLFVSDTSVRPDDADEDLDAVLRQLKEAGAGPTPQEKVDDKVTYSHLIKSNLNSALSPFVVPHAEDWPPSNTLGWANRGVGVKKMELLKDMLMQNTFLTGLQLAGNALNNDCCSTILSALSHPDAPLIRQLDLSSNAALDWRCAYPLAMALGASRLPAPPEPGISGQSRSTSPEGVRPPPTPGQGGADGAVGTATGGQAAAPGCLPASVGLQAAEGAAGTASASVAGLSLAVAGGGGAGGGTLVTAKSMAVPPSATGLSGALVPSKSTAEGTDGWSTTRALTRRRSQSPDGVRPSTWVMPPVAKLCLRRLLLSGVKLGDKGAIYLATALRENKLLKDLNLSRCSITDQGGTAIAQALSTGFLSCIDLSWNSLRGESARAMHETLTINGSLQQLNLSYNGFSDMDTALVLLGLTVHGTWRHVDLSYNNLGAGSALVIAELAVLLGKKAADYIRQGRYGKSWDLDKLPAGKVNTSGWVPTARQPEKAQRYMHHEELGTQLVQGPLLLDVGGNPLGFAGLRHVLHALDFMSKTIEEAGRDAASRRGTPSGSTAAAEAPAHADAVRMWPVQLVLHNCNVDITDVPPEGSEMDGMDVHSPNPFLASLMMIAEGGTPKGKKRGKKKGGKSKKDKGSQAPHGKEYFLTPQSQSLRLSSPAGKYRLDLAHPASWLLLRHLMDGPKVVAAASKQQGQDVVIALKDIVLNDRPSKLETLAGLQEVTKGIVSFTVQSPAVLLTSDPAPLTDQVIDWMVAALSDKNCNVLWKLSVISVACSDFYFSSEQALQLMDLFDPEIALSERLRAGEMMYARCTNPLDFWLHALPKLPPMQVDMLMQRLGEFSALDISNAAGRYMFNLSRSLDRFMALRLQEASALENSWKRCKYYLSWRNALLNGNALSLEGLACLRDYTIPDSGTLRVDYVTYKVPDPSSEPCTHDRIKSLVSELRAINSRYETDVLKLREEFLPFGQLRSEIKAYTPRGTKETKLSTGNWNASKTMSRTLKQMLAELQAEAAAEAERERQAAARAAAAAAAAKLKPPPLTHGGRDRGAVAAARAEALLQQQQAAAAAASPPPSPSPLQPGGQPCQEQQVWWMAAGFAGAPAMLRKHADAARAREEEAAGISGAAAAAGDAPQASSSAATAKPGGPGRGKGASSGSRAADKGGRAGGARGGKAGKGPGSSAPVPPPHYRTAGTFMSEQELEQAEELATQLLQLPRRQDVAQLLTKFSARHIARVLHVYLQADPVTGPRVCAAVLEALSPTLAIRLLFDMFDQLSPLLPGETKKMLQAGCSPKLVASLGSLQAEVNVLALKRTRQIRVTLQCFVASSRVTSEQLGRIISALRHEQDRCTAITVLWSHVIDRESLYLPFRTLTTDEQRQVMQRLGYWHCWSTLQQPQGMTFFLDLKEPEQKDIAKDIVRMACKASTAAKAQGMSQGTQHLLNLRGNGTLMTMPEDDKMMMSLESRYHSLEFDYAPTPEQVEERKLRGATVIQRQWLNHRRRIRLHTDTDADAALT